MLPVDSTTTPTPAGAIPSATLTPTTTRAPTATSTAPPSGSTFYHEQAAAMTLVGTASVISDPTASGGYAVKARSNLSGVGGSTTFSTSGTYAFTFGGREDYYAGTTGTHAHIAVYLDGATAPAGGVYVTNTSGYAPYTISVPVSAGTHSFQVLFDNDAHGGSTSTDRNAYIDYVAIATSAGTAMPTPTDVPPTATPTESADTTLQDVPAAATPGGDSASGAGAGSGTTPTVLLQPDPPTATSTPTPVEPPAGAASNLTLGAGGVAAPTTAAAAEPATATSTAPAAADPATATPTGPVAAEPATATPTTAAAGVTSPR